MKRLSLTFMLSACCAALFALLTIPAWSPAAPGQASRETGNRTEVLQGWSGKPGTEIAKTITGTKPFTNVSTLYSVGYRGLKISCTDGSGNTLPCRYQYNGRGAYLPIPLGERIFLPDVDTSYIRFGKYSTSTSSSIVISSEKM